MGVALKRIQENGTSVCLHSCGRRVRYDELARGIETWLDEFPGLGVKPGAVVAIVGHFMPEAVALLLALAENGNIIVPLDDASQEEVSARLGVAEVEHCFQWEPVRQEFSCRSLMNRASHPLIERLRGAGQAGIILFTSGSTGTSKAAIHSFAGMIEKHAAPAGRKAMTAMVFLKFDHIGGLNTMFWVLMNGGCMVTVEDRRADSVCQLIEAAKVELLPTTPSFLNMLVLSKANMKYDLSSLKLIAYGTEPMPESTLRSIHKMLPGVHLKQTYGLTELGILSTRSLADGSTFMAIREDDSQLKIEDGILHIKAKSPMLGYLNAASPFDQDGWYNTGDRVIVENGFMKILGRESEIINVGGEKVYPSEVESVLLEMDNVADVSVRGKPNPVVGHIVAAVFNLTEREELASLQQRVRAHCRGRLEPFKIPRDIAISEGALVSARFKRIRRDGGDRADA